MTDNSFHRNTLFLNVGETCINQSTFFVNESVFVSCTHLKYTESRINYFKQCSLRKTSIKIDINPLVFINYYLYQANSRILSIQMSLIFLHLSFSMNILIIRNSQKVSSKRKIMKTSKIFFFQIYKIIKVTLHSQQHFSWFTLVLKYFREKSCFFFWKERQKSKWFSKEEISQNSQSK